MEVVYRCCCGIDVHKKIIVACLNQGGEQSLREFGTTTSEIIFYLTEASEGQRVEQAKATEEGAPLLQPSSGFPTTGNPSAAEPLTGFPTELKKDTRNTDQENTDAENTHSLPIPSAPFTPPVEWS